MQIEDQWQKMSGTTIYATKAEWQHAREIMEKMIKNGEKPPFKISKESELNHSFLVATNNEGEPLLGVIARSKDQMEGVLGFGSFGVCKLVLWEDGKKNAIKIVPDNLDQYEIEIMQKLGLIRALFKREWKKRQAESKLKSKEPNQQWLAGKTITDKLYTVMPLIEGVDLNNYLSSNDSIRTMDIQRMVAISIVEKLQIMHQTNVLHNDLHTKNVMVDALLNAYLIDQGRSIDLNNPPTTFDKVQRLGRNDTLAPELITFKEELLRTFQQDQTAAINKTYTLPVSTASDIYSLGILFQQLFHPILTENKVKKLIEGMTKVSPEDRLELSMILKTLQSKSLIDLVNQYDEDMGVYPIVDNPEANKIYEESFGPTPVTRLKSTK